MRHGAGRDLLIGVEFVRADGVDARSGGRVVKNVAGYDLGRLLCGSFGTVGVITEAPFRLQPLPAASAWVIAPLSTVADLAGMVAAADSPAVVAAAVEVDWSSGAGRVAALVEGSAAGVAARAQALRALLPNASILDTAPDWWGRYPFADGGVGLRLAVPVSVLPAAIDVLQAQLGQAVTVRGSAAAGVVYAAVPATSGPESIGAALRGVRALLPHTGGGCVVLTAPPSMRDSLDLWGPVPGLTLMLRLSPQ
jgi:glycolate oxidase FAD binding subunit